LLPESKNQRWSAAHAAQRPAGMVAQLPKCGGAEVRQLVLFPVRPEVLDRIQFRRIGGKIFQPQTSSLLPDKVPHCAAVMTGQTVPDDQQLARNVPHQVREKFDDLWTADRAGKQLKVEVPPGHPCHGRQRLPVEVVLQNRRLAAWCPGAAAMRALAQSAFVDEDDRAALVFGLFFNSGQRFCFHCWIFSSFRSSARPVGR